MSEIENTVVPDLGDNPEQEQVQREQQQVEEVELSEADAKQLEEILDKDEEQLSDAEKEFLKKNEQFIEDDTLQKEIEEGIGIQFEGDFFSGEPTAENIINAFGEYREEIENQQFEKAFETIYNLDPRYYQMLRMANDQRLPFEEVMKSFVSNGSDLTQLSAGEDLKAEQVIREELAESGIPDVAINNTINQYKEDGSLISEANNIIQSILQEEQQNTYQMQQMELQREAQLEEMEDLVYDSIEDQIFRKGKVANFTIPVNERNTFFRYLDNSLDITPEGQVISYNFASVNDLENIIANAWFAFKGGDLNSFVEADAKTKNARKIKRRIKQTSSMPNGTGVGSGGSTVQLNEIFR